MSGINALDYTALPFRKRICKSVDICESLLNLFGNVIIVDAVLLLFQIGSKVFTKIGVASENASPWPVLNVPVYRPISISAADQWASLSLISWRNFINTFFLRLSLYSILRSRNKLLPSPDLGQTHCQSKM